jgi:hypothetical protein
MPTPPLSDELAQQAADLYKKHGATGAAKLLGINRGTFERRVSSAVARGLVERHGGKVSVHPSLESPVLEDEDIDIDELVAHRIKQFKQKKKAHDQRKCVDVKVKIDGPIGIQWFGDPHVDDDGTDIEALQDHTDLVNRTEGMFAANVGDTTNNWVGRLARLYAQQGTTAKQAWALAEWFVKRCPWLVMIGGNHDLWSGAGDPLNWIARGQTQIHAASEARFALCFPNGARYVVNSRHDFNGHSMWNPAHGQMKAAQMGPRDHLAVSGHKHISGYGVIKDSATGRVCHGLQVGSYKLIDAFAKERGFRDQMLGPCAVTVINPSLPETNPDMTKLFWDPYEGADYLTFKRKRK